MPDFLQSLSKRVCHRSQPTSSPFELSQWKKNPVAGRGREPCHRERWVAAKLLPPTWVSSNQKAARVSRSPSRALGAGKPEPIIPSQNHASGAMAQMAQFFNRFPPSADNFLSTSDNSVTTHSVEDGLKQKPLSIVEFTQPKPGFSFRSGCCIGERKWVMLPGFS